ncbi:hypothetical protein NDNC_0500 [Candidatus Nasuia deltocephalinicola]|uniref:Mechanosensitive ion channel n=1 Tax=Candidatus Nasuia deltocephalincola TaxID=1160784 RepID=A0A974WL64_9PROT|nr:hypothetical protein CU086_00765 [Candidatus Nasuia deltocephalinicola]WKD87063.1 mechanosensitive ion channel [Candidatus Nasuia deltocephalinicola]BEH03884.1 hypothetical protein NDNC_0500 [Candidatus Nasuia deltocephalinicola]
MSNSIYFFFIDLIIEIILILFNIKSFCNLFLMVFLVIYFLNIIIKKTFYEFYKKTKIYRYAFLNTLFFLTIFYLLDLKNNLHFIMNNIYVKIGNENLNMLSILFSIFWIIITFLINIYNSFIFNFFFKNISYINLNRKILAFKIFILFIFFFILFAGFSLMDLNYLILSVLGAALGIGISTNIQRIVNNYISGLIILSDKNFNMGDALSINGYQGVITQINNRYTVLRNLDCSEILVPNEKLVTDIIQNQSLYFSKGNLRINIQISYNNDYKNVLLVLIDSLNNIERVLKNPPPLSYVTGFTNMGIDIELSFWIIDAVRGVALVKSEAYLNILEIIKKHDIELSYYKKFLKLLD